MNTVSPTTWRRTYAAIFAANLITAIGMTSFLPFFPAVLTELGVVDPQERMLWTGVLFGAAPLAAAFMGPIWGSIGDRFGHKLMLLRSLLAIAVFVGAMGFARSPVEVLILRLGQGLFSGFIPPSIALVSVITPHERQGRVTGTLQAALPAGMILGPLVGTAVLAQHGALAIFFVVSAAATVSAILVAAFAHQGPPLAATLERFSPTTVIANTASDLRHIFSNPRVGRSIALLFAVQFGMGATNPQLQIFVEQMWDGDPQRVEPMTAWLSSAFAVTGLIATPIWGRLGDRSGHHRMMIAASLAAAVAFGAMAAASTYAALLILRILFGCAQPGVNVTAFGVAATEISGENRGGAFAAVFSARALAVSVGSIAGGALSAALGIRGLFLAAGIGIAVVAIFVSRAPDNSRDTRRPAKDG